MTRRKRSPADIAFHEAGHAVAATVSGIAIMHAEIEDGGGAVRLNEDEYEPRTREHAERLGVVALAGYAVLSIRDGREAGFKQGSSRSLPPFADDIWAFNDILDHACPPPPTPAKKRRDPATMKWAAGCQAIEARLRRRALTLVRRRWLAVERVARALLERRKLTGDEIRALVRKRRVAVEPVPVSRASDLPTRGRA